MKSFPELFQGRDDAFGIYLIEKTAQQKVQGRAYTKVEPLTDQHWQEHLEGKVGLGIIPIRPDGTCFWGAIDVDDYKLPLETLSRQLVSMELPLVLCRSKSGGAHLYIFLNEPISAIILRNKLFEYAASLGHPDAEIFPKQTEINDDDEIGNWINLPYFEAEHTTRYAYKDGEPLLELEEFLEYAGELSVTEEQLEEIEPKLVEALSDAPPCLQYLATRGVQSGEKDASLFNFAVYCKLKYPEDWEGHLEEINRTYVDPPAKSSTLVKVMKPHKKKTYFYTCNKPPIKEFCNRDRCMTQPFGIGQSESTPRLKMGILKCLETDPPIWYMSVESTLIQFDTSDLMDQNRFRRVCMERVKKIPPRMKADTWDRLLGEKLDKCEIIDAPVDAGPRGQFLFHLQTFCTSGVDDQRDGLLRGRPWTNAEEKKTYFLSSDLIKYLSSKKFAAYSTNQIYEAISSIGGKTKPMKVKGKQIRTWWVPEFEKQVEEFDLPEIEEPFGPDGPEEEPF